jgi:rhodanese-related sulfurtransferase
MIKTLSFFQYDAKQDGFIDAQFGTPAPEKLWLVEIGPVDGYDRVHIKRAIHLTLDQVRRVSLSRLPNTGGEIVLYGSRRESAAVQSAAEELARQGYYNLYLLEGSKEEWLELTRPRETTLVLADHFETLVIEEEEPTLLRAA